MAKWFVRPATIRVDLGDGEWAEIKERLSYGEQQQLNTSGMGSVNVLQMQDDPNIPLDLSRYTLKRMHLWLVDWSARDEQNKSVPITLDAIAALDGDMAEKIDAAIQARMAELANAKNPTTGA